MRQTFNNRRFSDARFSNQYRIVFCTPRKDLDHTPNFLIASNNRIELSLSRKIGQVARVALERLVLLFRILVCDLLSAANGNQDFENGVLRDAVLLEQPAHWL